METVKVDYAPKGVQFFYVYKPLAHPELNHYVSPFTLEERLMHVHEAERRLGSSITWLADTMDNAYHEAMGRTPNSELVVGPDGLVVARRAWSNPAALRADLERLVGPVEHPTTGCRSGHADAATATDGGEGPRPVASRSRSPSARSLT